MAKAPAQPPRIQNRKARFNYEVLDSWEAGIALTGSEVKSLRNGQASIDESFAIVERGQAILRDLNIAPYPMAGYAQHKPTRPRKLLMHRAEIKKLHAQVKLKGLTLVPLAIYFNERGFVKVSIGLCRGKKLHDKRASMKERDAGRQARAGRE